MFHATASAANSSARFERLQSRSLEIAKTMPPREQWTTKELTIEKECELALYEQKQRDAKEQQDEQSTGGDQ